MGEIKNFCVDWRTGFIEVDVGRFFGGANQKQIKKLLRLAQVHCTEEQRTKLLDDLKSAEQERTEAISEMAALRRQMEGLASPFFDHAVLFSASGYEKALVAQCTRLSENAKRIKALTWGAGV